MDLQKELGAREAATVNKISIYLPDHDRIGAPVPSIDEWIEAGLSVMAEIAGGATLLPPAQGVWNPEDGETVREDTSVIYSFIRDWPKFAANVRRLRAFLHTFGQQTNQGEVMVEFTGETEGGFLSRAYYISEYEEAA